MHVRQFISYLWSLRNEFAKYFIIGISGVILDMATLIFFKEIFGWWPVFAVIVNQALLLFYNFTLNKYWSFRSKEFNHKQILRYLVLACFNYIFSVVVMYVFNHKLNFDYKFIRLVSIAIMVSWNFLLYKYWVYKSS